MPRLSLFMNRTRGAEHAGALAAAVEPTESAVTAFSSASPGTTLPAPWRIATLPNVKRATRYSLVTDEVTIQTLAELGIVFLLFSLGLEFSLRHLRKVGVTALIAALAGIVLMFWAGYEIGTGFGWHAMDALFLGAMLSISSTTITIKAMRAVTDSIIF